MKERLFRFPSPGPLRVTAPRKERAGGQWRVSARVGGREVWFLSEAALEPAPEAFLSAFLLPAMASGRDLTSDSPVCPRWLKNIQRVRSLAVRWWGFRGGAVRAGARREGEGAPVRGAGLFFTGGVDSFHCLLSDVRPVDRLVYVAGYDVPLGDEERVRIVAETVRVVAQSRGIAHVMLATNLRAHPVFRRIGWWESHGGALAAAGHVLAGHLGRVVAGGSFQLVPMGTHPELFPGWSSARLCLQVQGAGMPRIEKLRRLLADPLVREHLRVCWSNHGSSLNCGRCEKCVRTLMEIETLEPGASRHLRTFPPGSPGELVGGIRRLPPSAIGLWEEIRAHTDDPGVARAVDALLTSARRRAARRSRLVTGARDLYRELRARASEIRRLPGR